MRSTLAALLAAALLLFAFALASADAAHVDQGQTAPGPTPAGCVLCHSGIEEMHPEAKLSCVDCHGGNESARRKEEAHVARPRNTDEDERVAGLDEDLGWRRFQNPMDLRVASKVCGECHAKLIEHLSLSLHGTTAGHLSDGFYEMGLAKKKASTYAVFPVTNPTPAAKRAPDELDSLAQVPAFHETKAGHELREHYGDLARKECLQCHLYSRGRAVRGRVGFDGDYRGEGCAACHVAYALDGLSSSADRVAVHTEPGHPERHSMQRAPSTQTCTSCHWGDASIGLNFRGLSQLPPGAPGGPEIPGTTSQLVNRQFYLSDPAITPPDVHHERGMHCIDCHTQNDVMGDGALHGAMEHAVEISCSDCHGTFSEPAELETKRGTLLTHMRHEGARVVLTSKVDGKEHDVPQLVDVLDPKSKHFNPRAAKAMNSRHANVACWSCHASWNPNFLGFHFDRNESLTQLDLLTGKRTAGRVTTQEKVFSTWKSFFAGKDAEGRIAPFLTGFSTMGSITDAQGQRILDQALPETAAGLSGMSMIDHQMHTTRKVGRSCVECHRSSATWGLGSANFQLTRELAFVAGERGLEVVALQRAQLSGALPLAELVMPDIVALAPKCDPLQGFAQWIFAAEGSRGIHVVDVRDPLTPKRAGFVECVDPQALLVAGDTLYCADGAGGLRVYDIAKPSEIHLVAHLPMFEARALRLSWPYLYIADGPAGLAIVDVRAPIAPRFVAGLSTAVEKDKSVRLIGVQTLFQYSRPRAQKDKAGHERVQDERIPARNLCALLDEKEGLLLADVTEPLRPRLIYPNRADPKQRRPTAGAQDNREFRGLVLASHVDLAQQQGGLRTGEHDYAYVLDEEPAGNQHISYLEVIDVSDAAHPKRIARKEASHASEDLISAQFYSPPFLQSVLLVPNEDGVFASDVSVSSQPSQIGAFGAIHRAYAVALESFPLDRMLDEQGHALKDVSHAGSRWLYLPEIERVLSVKGEELGTIDPKQPAPEIPSATARLAFARADLDGSGFLESDEIVKAGVASADANGDGRVSLFEFASAGNVLHVAIAGTSVVEPLSNYPIKRVDRDGDLARLFDGTDPHRFDKDGNARLDRAETERAMFAALDLDGNGTLDLAELSRAPGELRALRFHDAHARAMFDALDLNKNGKLEPNEFHMRNEDFAALDANNDGAVQLDVRRNSKASRKGYQEIKVEWPYRQGWRLPLPPNLTLERFFATFDKDGDKIVTRKELKSRPDLLLELDDNGDGQLELKEIKSRIDAIATQGVGVTVDDFLGRWDLNGDGKVEPSELAVPAWLLTRLGLRTAK